MRVGFWLLAVGGALALFTTAYGDDPASQDQGVCYARPDGETLVVRKAPSGEAPAAGRAFYGQQLAFQQTEVDPSGTKWVHVRDPFEGTVTGWIPKKQASRKRPAPRRLEKIADLGSVDAGPDDAGRVRLAGVAAQPGVGPNARAWAKRNEISPETIQMVDGLDLFVLEHVDEPGRPQLAKAFQP